LLGYHAGNEQAAYLHPGYRRRLAGSYGAHPVFSQDNAAMNTFVASGLIKRHAGMISI
jgi:hypothetical protein